MDFTKLRAQALSFGEDEEAVTVNTRALIDKVLARYSGEWTTLRELIQNAADAQADTVKIKFETTPSTTVPLPSNATPSDLLKHTLLHATLRRLLVSNDGLPFGDNDWARLKRIAEGNPNEDKIGAFGVGFYSVFADCEEPFVSSGKKAMAFYWKKDSLFTRQIQVPEGTRDTSFVLDYRNNTTPVPSLISICQFLATSMTFVALKNVELWLDDWKIVSIQKKASPSSGVAIPKDIETTTKERLMKVESLSRESVQMTATFMHVVGWRPSASSSVPKSSAFGETTYGRHASETPSIRSFFSRLTSSSSQQAIKSKVAQEAQAFQEIILEDLTKETTANVFLSVTTASIRTSVTSTFATELERATKKPPPKSTRLALLSSSYDEATASKEGNNGSKVANGVDIFASVLPGKKNGGRIFIGFPTNQTTGAGVHLSAPSLIPTVEREAVDLNARWVRTWNMEMLRVAGIISRVAYGNEMSDLGNRLQRWTQSQGRPGKIVKEDVEKFMPAALHILTSFTFEESTPSAQISQIIEESFWTSFQKASVDIYSTRGVLPTTTVRLAIEDLSGFVEGIPTLPKQLVETKMVKKLRDYGLISDITISDVKKELGSKALTTPQLIAFIGWIARKALASNIDVSAMRSLLETTVATVGQSESQGGIISLSSIKYFIQPSKVPPEFPIPQNTLPYNITQTTTNAELQALGWAPLEASTWIGFLTESTKGRNGLSSEQDITWSPKFSSQVLAVLSKQWDGLPVESKAIIIKLLAPLTVIPTKLGMSKPSDSYFASVKLFDDLPTIAGCPGVKEKFLSALGVRKTVDLDTIFQRLLSPVESGAQGGPSIATPRWNHVDLIVYLAGVKDDIPIGDMKKLRETPICAAEAGPIGQEASIPSAKRYKISELFEPKADLRHLQVPIIQWTGKFGYRPGSPEANFLVSLGLRSNPTVHELVVMMASTDPTLRTKSMAYFIANYETNQYSAYSLAKASRPFLPVEGKEKGLAVPSALFTNANASMFGFNVLRKDLIPHASKFGVAENPPMEEVVQRLIANPPKTQTEARVLFVYLSTRIGEADFTRHSAKLGDAQIVPAVPKSIGSSPFPEKRAAGPKHLAPRMCFIGQSETYGDIFDFVDFGSEANRFLLACGSSNEPSRRHIATMLASEPARVLGIVQSPEKYLSLLRLLAMSRVDLKRDKLLWSQMRISPFLLATKEISANNEPKNRSSKNPVDLFDDDDDTSAGIKQWVLQPAARIVIVDDYTTYQLFKGDLLAAPLEDVLEEFYLDLGSVAVGQLVEQKISVGDPLIDQSASMQIQKKILERSKVFLHSYPSDQLKQPKGWLEKNLVVDYVTHISIKISLRGYKMSYNSKQTAVLKNDSRSKKIALHITYGVDYYDISQALVRNLLKRPNNEAATLFESLLTSDLQGLKRRGFNVDRILRAQAAQARIAEDERQKQLRLEEQQIKEKGGTVKPNQIEEDYSGYRDSDEVDMPGAFGNNSPSPASQKKSRNLFSSFTRKLGFGDGEAQQQLQSFLGGHGGHSRSNSDSKSNRGHSSSGDPVPTPRKPGEIEKVSSPAAVQQNLVNAVQSSRAHNSSSVFSPPSVNQVKEQSTYCDSTSEKNIAHIGDASNGMRIYVSRDMSVMNEVFLAQNVEQIQAFSKMLHDVGGIYNIPRNALNIFYDEVGNTIAFNLNGSLFCNLRFFLQLHWNEYKNPAGISGAESWWWVVLAHELAHNLVKEHSSNHSYYTEMFIAQYFEKMAERRHSRMLQN
ncbi:hypothetical protein VE01_02430 [Pseudogymnoascus verrucosus]|uniref:Sacsin/Nov domain-containing protein n=1 Tax=Pseudogymnoascus verrucosus TaxID=342668 RepID=A0A1B8GT91_9PEZI|nr:uncharacterized protein VE01_02430 [Pseudogymnoascus verrucosus]OBT99020.1 hypothetical protein VE01_02430 [Pseudogymnoascus verrucosus]